MRRKLRKRAKYASTYIAPHKRYRDDLKKSEKSAGRASGGFFRTLANALGFVFGIIATPFLAIAGLFKKPKRPDISPDQAKGSESSLPAKLQRGPRRTGANGAGVKSGGLNVAVTVALLSASMLGLLFAAWALLFSDTSLEVSIKYNGLTRSIRTKADTVNVLLESNGIRLRTEDSINYSLDSTVEEGMEVIIQSAFPVAVTSKGAVTILQMRSGSVGQALAQAGVQYDASDEITHFTFEDVEPGMHIQHINIETKYETKDQTIEYKEEVIKDPSRYIDYNNVKVKGEDGARRVVRRLIYKDGELASSEIMNQILIKEAVNEVTVKGTKIKYQTNLTGDTREWRPKPTQAQIKSTMVASEITAYTHTGNRTATGKSPRIGYVAVNPAIIPYGTKLYIPGYGYCTAQDTGAFRHEEGGQKNQIDLFMNTEKECKNWGRKRNVTIYILK